ncbi:MAG: hypothetical protein RLZZ414_1420 [Bacteroidota bacterium]|jgi:hypothetical protein
MDEIIVKYLNKNSSKKNAVFIARYLYQNKNNLNDLIPQLIKVVINENHPLDFRAAWALEIFFLNHPKMYFPFANLWASLLSNASETCKRHIVKVITKTNYEYENDGELLDWCLQAIALKSTPLAVKVYCIYYVKKIVKKFPELQQEFDYALQITYSLHKEAPSILAALKKVKFTLHT